MVFFSLFILTATAHSQVVSPIEPAEIVNAPELRAIAVGLENDLTELHLLDATQQSVGKLSLRQFAFSKAFDCPVVEGKMTFGVPNGIDEEGVPLFKPVASVKWKGSYKQVCLIFIPKSIVGKREGTADYAIQILDMSQQFKLGHTQIMNFTPFDTMVRIGEHQTTIKPWSKSEFSEIKELTGVKMAQMAVYYQYNDTIHNADQTRYRYLERIRYITFIYPNLKNKRVAVNTVKDFGNLY